MSTSEIDRQGGSAVKEKPCPQLQADKTTTVSASELKERLPEILRAVEEKDETIEITKDGVTVARLVPTLNVNRELTPEELKAHREGVERFLKLCKEGKPSGMTLEELLLARRDGSSP